MTGRTRLAPSLLIFLFVILVLQCATPTQPSGGPPDRTPPQLEYSEPATGTTMFDDDRIRFSFSKYIDRGSFQDAFRMEPDLNISYEISWRRRTATVTFEEPLPDTTTIIFTLGTDLSDTRNNRINSPIQLALSTGPEIDDGRIKASVRNAETGEGMMGERVLLYRYPMDLSTGADYVGESDSAGVVQFNYLREGRYKAFWLDDRNRNRIWDRAREAAQPFPEETLTLPKGGDIEIGTVFVMKEDTIPPVLQAVGMLSEVRMRLRFSEEVMFEDYAGISVYHEDETLLSDVIPLYVDNENPNILMAQSIEALPDEDPYIIEMQGITDIAGNQATIGIDNFPGSDEADTTFARYISNDTRHGVYPDEPLIFRYAKLLDDSPSVLDSLILLRSQDTYAPWTLAETRDNLLFVYPDGTWQQGEEYEIRLWDEDRMEYRTIHPRFLFEEELGDIAVNVESPRTDTTQHRLRLINDQGFVERSETFLNEIELTGIPGGRYLLVVFEMRDGIRNWDSGRVDPFRPPARYFIQRDVPVEPRLTGQVYVEWQ